ncbi:MAG: PrgI family protein, partial [Treponema sp.]|nr:PrgI family protein [Treponema sp.]
VPKDLSKVRTKVAFNLTKRQLVCFGGGALAGLPLYFALQKKYY